MDQTSVLIAKPPWLRDKGNKWADNSMYPSGLVSTGQNSIDHEGSPQRYKGHLTYNYLILHNMKALLNHHRNQTNEHSLESLWLNTPHIDIAWHNATLVELLMFNRNSAGLWKTTGNHRSHNQEWNIPKWCTVNTTVLHWLQSPNPAYC